MQTLIRFVQIYGKGLSEYRSLFFGGNIFMFIANLSFYVPLYLLALNSNNFGGFTASEYVLALAIGFFAFLFGVNIFAGVFKFGRKIVLGDFDRMLLRPKSLYSIVQMDTINASAFAEIVFGCFFLFVIPLQNLAYLFFFSILGGLIFNRFMYMMSLLSVFLEQDAGRMLFDVFINFKLYPSTVFHPIIKFVAMYIIPGGLISFVPILALQNYLWYFVYAGVFVALWIVSSFVEYFALKHYSGG